SVKTAGNYRSGAAETSSPSVPADTHNVSTADQNRYLHRIVDECLVSGVLLVRTKRLSSVAFGSALDMSSAARPSIRIALRAALSTAEGEAATEVIQASAVKPAEMRLPLTTPLIVHFISSTLRPPLST
ncbi:unnamed protein product, partial [Tilletia controversa]